MSWTELMPGGPGLPPGLTLGDCLRHGEGGHCADCAGAGKPCPDHRQDPAPETEAGWTVEGVVLCPRDCGLYFDFNGTPQDLADFISEHDCAFAQTGENFK